MRAELTDEAYREALDRALRLLEHSAKSERALLERLIKAGYDEATVESVLARLRALGLIDDVAFARRYAEERGGKLGPEAIVARLEAKGIEREIAWEAVLDVDEEERATEAAWALLPKVSRYPLAEQGLRLLDHLVRRGFNGEIAEEVARRLLPPEGWD